MSMFVKAQTVENIHTKQVDEKINIYYQIKNSWDDQFFKITISCLINNSKKIVLKSITGDVGNNIIGGKDEYRAVWDVLQDVDELTNAEFFVKIELIDDGTIVSPGKTTSGFKLFKYEKENKGQFFVAVTFPALKIGYMSKWGFAVTSNLGLMDDFPLLFMGTISKSIVRKQDVQWNANTFWGLIGEGTTMFGIGTEVAIGHLYTELDLWIVPEGGIGPNFAIGWRF